MYVSEIQQPSLCQDTAVHLPSIISPQRDPADPARFYMNVWKAQCLPILPTELRDLVTSAHRLFVVVDMMTALSACRLSRSLPQRRLICNLANNLGSAFRPDSEHESVGCQRYGAVMRQVARWESHNFAKGPLFGLTFMVMFCLTAASMGSFSEFRLHSEATRQFVQVHSAHLIRYGAGLLSAWVDVKMQDWWRRAYFCRPDFHQYHSSLSLDSEIEAALVTAGKRRAIVSVILSESHRLNMAAVVSCHDWEGQDYGRNTTQNSSEALSAEHYEELLTLESAKLDEWSASLPALELPVGPTPLEQTVAGETQEALSIYPLRFHTHDAAINFAYYVVARIMQVTSLPKTLDCPVDSYDLAAANEETEFWVLMLLRIAAGIDWQECIRRNVFTIGITSLLLAAALRSRSLAVGVWMQNWLEERLTGNVFEEANFPVFQALDTLRLINRERRAGWDALALFQTVDDGGGQGKFGSYYSQAITTLWIYGKCRRTGKLCAYRRNV